MTNDERNQRAWVLRSMREHHRAPRWLSDSVIFLALEIQSIIRPSKISRENERRLLRVKSECSVCLKSNLIGCKTCWGGHKTTPPALDQIGNLRAAQRQEIMPRWLSDAGLARAFRLDRSLVSAQLSTEILCKNCSEPGENICLVCLVSRR